MRGKYYLLLWILILQLRSTRETTNTDTRKRKQFYLINTHIIISRTVKACKTLFITLRIKFSAAVFYMSLNLPRCFFLYPTQQYLKGFCISKSFMKPYTVRRQSHNQKQQSTHGVIDMKHTLGISPYIIWTQFHF